MRRDQGVLECLTWRRGHAEPLLLHLLKSRGVGPEHIHRGYADEAGRHGNKPSRALSCSRSLIYGYACVCINIYV